MIDQIPRALSTDIRSIHYRPDVIQIGEHLEILFEGNKLEDVVEYDMDRGRIIRLKRTNIGYEIDGRGDQIIHETLEGRVEVRWVD